MIAKTARELIFRILPGTRLHAYELDLLRTNLIPQALSLEYWEKDGYRYILVRLPSANKNLLAIDRRKMRHQALGVLRLTQLLQAFADAEQRLLRPSFDYINLSLIFLDKNQIRFPLLPVAEGEALRLPEEKVYLDFWQEWAGYYHVQKELAEVGRNLTAAQKYKELATIMQNYLGVKSNQSIKAPFPWHKQAQRRNRERVWRSHTAKLRPLPGESVMAELFLLPDSYTGQKKTRLALLAADEFIMGRDPSLVDLCFADPWIGRQHASILKQNGSYFMEDLASLNGSYVDGYRLRRHEMLLLPERCIIRLGKTNLEFRRITTAPYFVPKSRSPASPRPGTM